MSYGNSAHNVVAVGKSIFASLALPRMGSVPVAGVPLSSGVTFTTRIPALDGLRGIAILLVLLWHAVFEVRPDSLVLRKLLGIGILSWSGVELFFVLSGFLIGGILLDTCDSPRYFKTFYIRRAYRILPLYGVLVALYLLRFLPWNVTPAWLGDFSESRVPWFSYITFSQNIFMAYFCTFGVGAMVATWSLAVEKQFYLTAPVIVKRISRSKLVLVLAAVVIGVPLLRAVLHWTFRNGDFANYLLMPCRADTLSLGVLAAIMVRSPIWWNWLVKGKSKLYGIAGVLFATLGALAYAGYGGAMNGPMVIFGYSCLGLFYTCILLLAASQPSGLLQRALCSKGLMKLGVLAYCTYLFHLPTMAVWRRVLGICLPYSSYVTQFLGGAIGVVFTVVVAALSWRFVERPLVAQGHAYKY